MNCRWSSKAFLGNILLKILRNREVIKSVYGSKNFFLGYNYLFINKTSRVDVRSLFFAAALQAIQRVTSDGGGDAGAGFASLKFYGGGMAADVVLDGGIGGAATANHMWALNTKYIYFRPHSERNFVPIGGERQAVNQDAIVKLYGWAGNLTCSGSEFNGVLIA